jgi:hypothetical protein
VSSEEAAILGAIAFLQVKHFILDFALQRPYEFFRNKVIYGHPGGLVHAGLHALGTLPVLLILPAPLAVALAIPAAEFLIHYHLDWGKEQVQSRVKLTPAGRSLVLGADQLAHQLTYVGIVAVLVLAG